MPDYLLVRYCKVTHDIRKHVQLLKQQEQVIYQAAQQQVYKDKSFLSQHSTGDWGQDFQNITNYADAGLNVAGSAYRQLKTTATSNFT